MFDIDLCVLYVDPHFEFARLAISPFISIKAFVLAKHISLLQSTSIYIYNLVKPQRQKGFFSKKKGHPLFKATGISQLDNMIKGTIKGCHDIGTYNALDFFIWLFLLSQIGFLLVMTE